MPTISQSKSTATSSSKAYTSTININKGQMNANAPQPDYNNSSLAIQDKTALLTTNGNNQTVNLKRLRAKIHGNNPTTSSIEIYNVVNNGTPTLIATIPLASGNNSFTNQAINQAINLINSGSAKLEWQVTPTNTDSNVALEVQLDYEVI